MKNGVFGEYFARFEGIWQTKCFKDEEVDKLRVEEKAKDGEEIPMRAMTMMKRNTNENEEVYRWYTDDYDKEEVKKIGGYQVKWRGEEGDDEEEQWKVEKLMNPCQEKIDDAVLE